MITRSDIGFTRHSEPYVQLSLEDGTIILKAFLNPKGDKILIFLHELVNYTQTLIDPEKHLIEFDRNSRRLKP